MPGIAVPTPLDLTRVFRLVVLDGLFSHVMGVLTTGAILVGFALHLGASNLVIGMISGIPFLAQLLQIPAVYVINRIGHRRGIVVLASLAGRSFWCSMAAIPWVIPPRWQLETLLVVMIFFFSINALVNCAWSSWMRDLIPDQRLGMLFGWRMSVATGIAAALSLVAGFAVDHHSVFFADAGGMYSVLFLVGGGFGMVGVYVLWRTPEPTVHVRTQEPVLRLLAEPFRDRNYRNLLAFLGIWAFAANLAAPFFSVYMLKQLQMSMTWVLALNVCSQVVNVLFYYLWGRISDRYTNKSVLGVTGFLFLLTFLVWPFTTMPLKHNLTLPLLVLIHVAAGIATAGVTLCTGNIALKIAPYGRATAYLAVNALISGLAATTAPVMAGVAADWFSLRELRLEFQWTVNATHEQVVLQAINLSGHDFVFLIAFAVGLFAMHRLLAVREEGEVKETVVLHELYMEVRRIARHVSNVAGLRQLGYFPFVALRSRDGESREGGD